MNGVTGRDWVLGSKSWVLLAAAPRQATPALGTTSWGTTRAQWLGHLWGHHGAVGRACRSEANMAGTWEISLSMGVWARRERCRLNCDAKASIQRFHGKGARSSVGRCSPPRSILGPSRCHYYLLRIRLQFACTESCPREKEECRTAVRICLILALPAQCNPPSERVWGTQAGCCHRIACAADACDG